MARLGFYSREAGSQSCNGRRRVPLAVLSFIWVAARCGGAAAHDGLERAVVPSIAVDPQQFLIAIALLMAGGALITWLSENILAVRDPRKTSAARDQAIAMLRASEARLAALTLVSPVGVMLADANGECLYSNGRFQLMTGRRHGDLAGRGWLGAVHPDDRDRVLAEWHEAISSGKPFHKEFRILIARGEELWVFGQAETHHGDDPGAGTFVCTVTDISERKRAEGALEESERQLRKAQQLAGIGNWERDLFNDTIEWSDQVYVIYGLEPQSERMNLFRLLDMVHPDDRAEVEAEINRSVAEGERYSKTHRIVRPSGEIRTVQQLGEVTRDRSGRPVRFFGTVQDITDLRRAEDAKRRSEAWFRTGFIAGGAGLVVADAAGRYLSANPAFCKLVGYSEAELRGMSTRELTHPDDRDSHVRIWQRLVAGEAETNAREKRYLTRSGDTVWAIAAAAVFQDPADGEVYVISNIQDITERKLAEQALAEREKRMRVAQKLANMGSWERDLDSSVIKWSDQLYEIFGLEPGSYDGTYETFISMVHPDDRSTALQRRRVRNNRDDPSNFNFRIIRPDGEIRYVRTERRIENDSEGRPKRAIGIMQDVTELRDARIALEASEARFRGVFEAGGAGIVVLAATGRFVQINRAFADFVGYDVEELAELTIFDVLRPADHEEMRCNRDNLFGGLVDQVSTEFRFAHRDGGARWATVSATYMTNPSDGGRLMILTVQDITRRKQADEALAHKTRLIDLINELAVAANNATDFEDVVQHCLKRVCEVAGWSIGHAYRSTGDGEFETMRIWHLDDAIRFEPYRQITERLPSADGHGMARAVLVQGEIEWRDRIPAQPGRLSPRAKVAVEVGLRSGFAVPVRAGDEVVAVLEFLSDKPIARDDGLADAVMQIGTELGRVYERQRAETALRRREEQFSQIIENAPLWIFVKDREGRYLLVNKSITSAYGLSPEDMLGHTQGQFYHHPEAVEKIRAGDLDVIENRVKHAQYTVEFHAPDGDTRILRIIKVPFTTQDGDTAVLGMAADITDEKRAEAELRRAHRMDALGHMTGGVAHDFNNLLTIILGNLQLLLRRLDDPATRTLAETAERAAQRGADVTGRLLAFARSQPLAPRPTDMNGLIDDVIALVERALGPGIEVERKLAAGLWATMADPAQVENALINLAVNARDAMPDGGKVILSTANVSLGRTSAARRQIDVEPGDYVRVALRDTGVGMTEETAARALEPFFTTKDVGKGSGLGLSSIYGFARQSGGGVRIETAPGSGTKVSIFLPRCEPLPDAAVDDQKGQEVVGRLETVLLVEDEPDVRNFATQALTSVNYRVVPVPKADKAMALLRADEEPVDVLFTDIVLPGEMDGWALAEAARMLRPELKIILSSGNWELAGKSPPHAVSDAAILQKPYSHKELARVVQSAIDRGAAKRRSI